MNFYDEYFYNNTHGKRTCTCNSYEEDINFSEPSEYVWNFHVWYTSLGFERGTKNYSRLLLLGQQEENPEIPFQILR